MIELSIVLLILSLLVGSLLVGRQIVDRAKIQRIIFEFDYYEKAFHQFYDTYRTVPTGLTKKECMKYPIFGGEYVALSRIAASGGKPAHFERQKVNISHDLFCNSSCPDTSYVSKKIYDSYTYCGKYLTKGIMTKSGLFSDVYDGINLLEGYTCRSYVPVADAHLMTSDIDTYYFPSSFDTDSYLGFVGFADAPGYRYNDVIRGYHQRVNNVFGVNTGIQKKHELNNLKYAMTVKNHNAIILFNRTTDGKPVNGFSSKASGCLRNSNGAISARLTSELDAKIDDGRPGSGKILALKTGHSRSRDATQFEINKTCFDRDFEEVDKAIYTSDTNLKYGCNIIKVMEDVK